ncbi:MAG: transaldolase family protein, partial [Spongiibacteraceae bacterium]|nr:transaldolase family protein [Spongiibacteraceae bacterium]
MSSKLAQLRAMTDVVADTGDIDAIATYKPLDATTNPSLLLKAAQLPRYQPLVADCEGWARRQSGSSDDVQSACIDQLAENIG